MSTTGRSERVAGGTPSITLSKYVKGVFISRFDLSFGPTPIARYPADFIGEGQANQLAMQSMVQLNTSKGKTVDIVLTMDDLEAIGFGILGSLSSLGYYSLIVFFSIRAPKQVSDMIDDVLGFLGGFNTKLVDHGNPDDSFAREIFEEICRQLDLGERRRSPQNRMLLEQDRLIMRIVGAMKPVAEMDLRTIESLDIPLAHSLKVLLERLNLVATSLNLPYSLVSLRDMLFEIQRRTRLEKSGAE
jgi:hypothetical protein